MNRDDIIRMAVTCHLVNTETRDGYYMEALERFAELVAAAERERDTDLLRQALEALEDVPYMSNKDDWQKFNNVVSVLRTRLEGER